MHERNGMLRVVWLAGDRKTLHYLEDQPRGRPGRSRILYQAPRILAAAYRGFAADLPQFNDVCFVASTEGLVQIELTPEGPETKLRLPNERSITSLAVDLIYAYFTTSDGRVVRYRTANELVTFATGESAPTNIVAHQAFVRGRNVLYNPRVYWLSQGKVRTIMNESCRLP